MARSYVMLAVVAGVVVAIHAIVYGRFLAAVRQACRAAQNHGLPDWLPAQVERVRGRASRFILGGAVVAIVAAFLRIATDSPWSLAAASFAAGFNAVAFFVEYAGFVALRRLRAEIQARASRPAEAPAPSPHDPEPMSI
ncbi:MFS transporter [Paludisphaera rhizosphaerae]|uniref:MFS transporter n=1 Tax=Paludisphaera rhizosphaerae TaxID=2711216 RepID=UPI0013EBE1B0|nr:MFS transporter [Paludisphaera rhizosphaerae]